MSQYNFLTSLYWHLLSCRIFLSRRWHTYIHTPEAAANRTTGGSMNDIISASHVGLSVENTVSVFLANKLVKLYEITLKLQPTSCMRYLSRSCHDEHKS